MTKIKHDQTVKPFGSIIAGLMIQWIQWLHSMMELHLPAIRVSILVSWLRDHVHWIIIDKSTPSCRCRGVALPEEFTGKRPRGCRISPGNSDGAPKKARLEYLEFIWGWVKTLSPW